ncbi:MAG TPA: TRAP transporter large permease subunit [Spirochaetia bacterium]|nr:TRAP transporter large permease subunit [Spirochaetales bacterium]HPD80284.1 TRAP transporter large permease subunit [Spirochaetales bacterium]HQG39889.1 TRAP transporter large permease subunit [Spirochaetales bacterium]HRS65194.1 TRAP transporter large permease subunit [Spirochaetia bacterium]
MKRSWLLKIFDIASFFSVFVIVFVASIEFIVSRIFQTTGIPSSIRIIEQSMIALTFFSAAKSSYQKKHLTLTNFGNQDKVTVLSKIITTITVAIALTLFSASCNTIILTLQPFEPIYGIPIQVFALPMILGYLGIITAEVKKENIIPLLAGLIIGLFLSLPAFNELAIFRFNSDIPVLMKAANFVHAAMDFLRIFLILGLIGMALLGLPLFMTIAGIALVLYVGGGQTPTFITYTGYNLLRDSSLPAIPLFTVAGFILSKSGATKRLVKLFREAFGWFPGGEAFAAVLVCVFFTTFTGANGVTILAMGSLLAGILLDTGAYQEKTVHGLLTASSSIGLLFPPSIAVIVYFIAGTFIYQNNPDFVGSESFTVTNIFLGTIVPGIIFSLAMGGSAVWISIKNKAPRHQFNIKEAGSALLNTLPELLIPLIIVLFTFTGLASLTETASLLILYLLIVEGLFTYKDKKQEQISNAIGDDFKFMVSTVSDAVSIAGGTLIIIAMARALSNYLIDFGLAEYFVTWTQNIVHSKVLFLLLLNILLLITGCLMDIFSATLVIVPLIIPLGNYFGIHPVHLAAIFITNLTIGFLTPPIGMNLFLASYAFNKPVLTIYKSVVPFFLLQLVVLVLVTWIPALSLVFVR